MSMKNYQNKNRQYSITFQGEGLNNLEEMEKKYKTPKEKIILKALNLYNIIYNKKNKNIFIKNK